MMSVRFLQENLTRDSGGAGEVFCYFLLEGSLPDGRDFRHKLVIRIYRWRCTDRAIEPLARHDVSCAKGPSLLAISLIYSGICGQGKNADTPFATVNPEGQARTPTATALADYPARPDEWKNHTPPARECEE